MGGHTYDRMAPIYERLTDAYSFGCVPRAKRQQLTHIEPGTRVLYLGVGPGSDALGAAEKGANVTGVDLSTRMITVASRRFEAAGRVADLQSCDLFAFEPRQPYDVVVANFLLDCFNEERRPQVVERMRQFLRPGGTALVTDTGRPRGSRIGRISWYGYHGIAYATTWIQGITPFVPTMDLDVYLRDAGFTVTTHTALRPWRGGPVLFESLVGTKP
jgi:demethylphylloquinol methyltransferase